MNDLLTGGNVSQSITITTEQLQQMIQAATDHALAAALQAAGGQVADVGAALEPLPEPEPTAPPVDPRWAAIMKRLRPVSRSLRWVTVSGNSRDCRIFVNMGHTDPAADPYKITTWVDGWKIDLDADPAEIDQIVDHAIRVATRINGHVDQLVDRLGLHPSGPNLFAQSSSNGNGNGGRHE